MNAQEILKQLEENLFDPLDFLWLGYVYSDLIDCRLNLFKDKNQWAIVAERLGYSQKGGMIDLAIQYFGNCILPIITPSGTTWDQYSVYPITYRAAQDVDGDFFSIRKDVKALKVRNTIVTICQDREKYERAGIHVPDHKEEIGWENVGRYLILNHSDLFRATDEELYKYLPKELEKIMVLDEWHHKDYKEAEELVDINRKNVASDYFDRHGPFDSYETYPMLAKVLATGDVSFYKPTMTPNTHWKFWPEAGSL